MSSLVEDGKICSYTVDVNINIFSVYICTYENERKVFIELSFINQYLNNFYLLDSPDKTKYISFLHFKTELFNIQI